MLINMHMMECVVLLTFYDAASTGDNAKPPVTPTDETEIMYLV